MQRKTMLIAIFLAAVAGRAVGQVPVTAVAPSEPLFTSPDPKLNRNKQAAYHIARDLLEAGHWELADQWLTERYIHDNPNAGSGRTAVIDFFTKVLKVQPRPIPQRLSHPITAVVAEGDYVIVVHRAS